MAANRSLPMLAACLFATCLLRADELRLDDGRVLVGRVRTIGADLEVTTREGVVRIAANQVIRHRSEDELRRELLRSVQTAERTAFSRLELSKLALSYGLDRDLWRLLGEAIELTANMPQDANEALARWRAQDRRNREFMAQLAPLLLEPSERAANPKQRVQALVANARPEVSRAQLETIVELLVREVGADAALQEQARRASERGRIAAVQALKRRTATGNEHFVWRTAIVDRAAPVREAACALVQPAESQLAVAYLAPGLDHRDAKVRVRTAEAFAEFGGADAMAALVAAAPAASAVGRGQRANLSVIHQQAYVRDFNVEVASASFIADPQVDVLASGTVLDVTVFGVSEVQMVLRSYRKALQRLAHSDPGEDIRKWPQWLSEQARK